MTYYLGVDLGTTYTAAAINEAGRASITELGNRTPTIPSVVFLAEDGTVLTGEAANRRAATEPTRVAREFKRRIGDTTPLLLGGTPYSADALSAMLLRWTVDRVSERQGSAPTGICVSYPANWGPFKRDLLDQAIRQADLDGVTTITEPEAAVLHYASHERVDTGAVVAVFDLGGGTFDAAVVRKTADGVEVLGEPEGIERLGGIDFDEAVVAHVRAALGDAITQLDPADPVAMAAMARLRQECVEAKEALSSDSEVSIPVMLPTVATEVRLTRAEFERMISPTLAPTITALQRALRSANVTPDDVDTILLAGGSSRIPLVAQMVGAEMGRPVAVDAHPKHAVALGAALAAETAAGVAPVAPPPVSETPGAEAAAAAAVAATAAAVDPVTAPEAAPPTEQVPVVEPTAAMPAASVSDASAGPPTSAPPPGGSPVTPAPSAGGGGSDNRRWLFVGLAAVVLAVAGFFAATQLGGGGDEEGLNAGDDGGSAEDGADEGADGGDDGGVIEEPTNTPVPTTRPTNTPVPTSAPTNTPVPTPEPTPTPDPDLLPCPDDGSRCIEIDSISVDGAVATIDWTTFGFNPNTAGDFHGHFFWDIYDPEQAGNNAADFGAINGSWNAVDDQPYVRDLSDRPEGATKFCVTVGTPTHGVDNPDFFQCIDVPES